MEEGGEGATSEVREAALEEDEEEANSATGVRAAEATTALTEEEAEEALVAAGGDLHQMATSVECPGAAWAGEETRAGAMVAVAEEGGDSSVLVK